MLNHLLGRERWGGRRLLAVLGFRSDTGEERQRQVSDRKLRLFAVACCERLESLWRDERSRQAVRTSAAYADGRAGEDELRAAAEAAAGAVWARSTPSVFAEYLSVAGGAGTPTGKSERWAARAAAEVAAPEIDTVLRSVSHAERAAIQAVTESPDLAKAWAEALGAAARADLLREIIGNPFRPSPPLQPAVLGWNDGTVRRIAEAIATDQAYDRLPILADALLDAGCDNEELLAHCRSESPHVRGCWAMDLILGRS